jgi:putative acetyltransferase
MEKSILSAIEFGFKKIYLESIPHFSNAIGIYEKPGFQKIKGALGHSGHS